MGTFFWPNLHSQEMSSHSALFPTCLQRFTKIKSNCLIQVTKTKTVMKRFAVQMQNDITVALTCFSSTIVVSH